MYNLMDNLIKELNNATVAYDKGTPIMSDLEWDTKYFQLVGLEAQLGITRTNSPTQKIYFKTVSALKKVKHNHPMLSLAKTKSIDEINNFIGDKDILTMCKMDGLTCSLYYANGRLVRAETRGNGVEGEDVTHNALVIKSIPNSIPYRGELVIDGEIICTYDDFEEFSEEYKNPRNFAAGSIRLLNAEECSKRKLTFVVWDIIKGFEDISWLSEKLYKVETLGFTIVPLFVGSFNIDDLKAWAEELGYPIDGLVVKYNDCKYYESLGKTDHHFRGGLAYKFYDEAYPTTLKNIEWTMGRTGVLTPVAIFEPIDIDGSTVERASLHNISVMDELSEGFQRIGDTLYIFKANQIIPQVDSWKHNGDYNEEKHIFLPEVCPICGEKTKIIDNNGVRILVCTNEQCEGKLINKLDHFFGKKGLDVKGLSKATFEKLIDWGWVSAPRDVFILYTKRDEWINKPGFGIASVERILDAINAGRKCTLQAAISAAGIPLIGNTVSKTLSSIFGNYQNFRDSINNKFDFTELNGFGYEMNKAISNFDYSEIDFIVENFLEIQSNIGANLTSNNNLEGITIVITGKLKSFKNRDELKAVIESHGGKVAGAVSKNTKYLINNDNTSESAKNVSAKKLGVPIITEEEFIKIFDI